MDWVEAFFYRICFLTTDSNRRIVTNRCQTANSKGGHVANIDRLPFTTDAPFPGIW